MSCRSVNSLKNMQKTVALDYFWRRSLPNFKFNCIVLRTCLRMPMHRNWTGVLSTHFHLEMAEGCNCWVLPLQLSIYSIYWQLQGQNSMVLCNCYFEHTLMQHYWIGCTKVVFFAHSSPTTSSFSDYIVNLRLHQICKMKL